MKIDFTLNGRPVSWDCEAGENLRDLLRRRGIVSLRNSCDGEGSCGLCAILLDGVQVNSCLLLAPMVEGRNLRTVESLSTGKQLGIAQRALLDVGAVQCGFCAPAVSLALAGLIERCPDPTPDEIADSLSGTFCRCTGYRLYFEAARLAARRLADPPAAYEHQAFRDDLRVVGKASEKVDSACLVRGERLFVEDRVDADACHLAMLRSPHAHARITSMDVSAARAAPGVVEVLTWQNCPPAVYTQAGQGFPEPSPYDRRMFSRHLRHVGDRVAAILAETPAQALAALSLIRVEYEVLPAVLSIEQAAAPGSPVVHGGPVSYISGSPPAFAAPAPDPDDDPIVYQFPIGADPARNLAASVSGGIGDMARGFAEADLVIEREYIANRVQCTPMEPHVVYARVDQGRLVIRASTQVPWHLRRIVAGIIGISENKVRVIKERVGGGYGVKQDIVLEDVAAWLAWNTGRPVFHRYTRREEFVAARTRHPMTMRVKLGAKRDGRLCAIDLLVQADTGAFGEHCLTVPMNACSKSLPLFVCDNVHFEVQSWYTNLPSSGAYQGYGAPQGSFALQTAMAELACELGLPQLDFLEKNRVRSGSRLEILKCLGEGRAGAAVTLSECGLGEMLERGRSELAALPPALPSAAPPLSTTAPGWKTGRAGVIIQQGSGLPGLDASNAELRLLSDGSFLVLSGGADLGTGLDTVLAKLAAEALGVDQARVTVVSGDTDTTPFDKGAYASSGTFFSGKAALLAALDLRARILAVAAIRLGQPVESLVLEAGGIIRGASGSTSYAEIAHDAVTGQGHGELSGRGSFKTEHSAFPFGAHFVEAAVDERSGEIRLTRYLAYQDCGTPINPDLAKGQIYGAVMKSIGHSLFEEMVFDNAGRCLTEGFFEYRIARAYDLPADFQVELHPVDDEEGPYGAKSVSEIAMNGAAPAIAIAIHEATGVWLREWPFTPERVLRALGKI